MRKALAVCLWALMGIVFVSNVVIIAATVRAIFPLPIAFAADGGQTLKRFRDNTTGFVIDLPQSFTMDIKNSPKFITFESPKAKLTVSKESPVGPDTDAYIDYYFFRFILDERFQRENQITLLRDDTQDGVRKIQLRIEALTNKPNIYTFILFKTSSRNFYRCFLKYRSEDAQEMEALTEQIADHFSSYVSFGNADYAVNYFPVPNENWTPETKTVYNAFSNSKLKWGLFTEDIYQRGINETIPQLEAQLEYKFEILLAYVHLNGTFPVEFMNRAFRDNRLVELTYQMTLNNNEDLYARSPSLDLYRTGDDERIRAFARAAKAFGKPFLFRLNNEMNSDWTSYGGVNNLMDPDIFADNWRTVYRIFQEEGVNNAIWIFNPNDRDCPPNGWNSFAAYYPGNEYVHMLGVTGYNNGTYYSERGLYWRSFETIYDSIVYEYDGMFDSFPWIITEFSSSSHGGDKSKWIQNMFANFNKYPQIKAAVWFNAPDYDPGKPGVVANPYWLDETPETLAAFKNGLHR